MLDLHCHLLPAIDDGAVDLDMALQMARMAADDGIRTVVCTPHIYPGVYDNTRAGIEAAVARMQCELDTRGIRLALAVGADVHLAPRLVEAIAEGRVPTLAQSRYLLLEPPHHTAPPRFEEAVFDLMAAGIVPVITHPERLSWVEDHFGMFERLAERGAWLQITGGALTGRFGRRVNYWAERFVGEGHAMVLATDAHHPQRRPPLLAEARERAARLVGESEAHHLVSTRPHAVLSNDAPESVPAPVRGRPEDSPTPGPAGPALSGFLRRLRMGRGVH